MGDDPASRVYVGSKARACQEVGVRSSTQTLPATTSAEELAARIEALNADPDVDGILLQLPLPAPLDGRRFLDLIDPAKDVDGFHPRNVGLLQQGRPAFVPVHAGGRDGAAGRQRRGAAGRATPSSWGAPTSSASPWRRCCCSATPRSPCATRGPGTCPRSAAWPTCWWRRWASRRWWAAST